MNEEERLSFCPIAEALKLFSGKWKLEILWQLKNDRLRFNTLQRSLGHVSQKILSKQLRELERDGLVNRIDFDEIPPRVEYEATELLSALIPIFDALVLWSTENSAIVTASREAFDQRKFI